MKKKLLAVCLILMILAVSVQGTLSYGVSEYATHNVITTGHVKLLLREEFPEGGIPDAMPGAAYVKRVWVENAGSVPAWVRIRMTVSASAKDGTALSAVLPDGQPAVAVRILPGWELQPDGFYYYDRILQPGQCSSDLMAQAILSPALDNAYQGGKIFLELTAFGVQADHNGTEVLQAQGWPDPDGT